MGNEGKQSYYEILDVSFNANSDSIRTAYIRAKNAYNRDSLAAYSLFDKEESKKILDEIEEAFTILSDSDKRRRYDESHGIISSEDVYESYHKGNHAVAAFSRGNKGYDYESEHFQLEDDPFRKSSSNTGSSNYSSGSNYSNNSAPTNNPYNQQPTQATPAPAPSKPAQFSDTAAARAPEPEQKTSAADAAMSHIERLRAMQSATAGTGGVKHLQVNRAHETDPAMEEKIAKCEDITGTFLKQVREYKRISPEEIMDILKISKNYLAALEDDNFAKLPANVFVRGFVIQYAKALKMDHEKVTQSYMTFLKAKRPG